MVEVEAAVVALLDRRARRERLEDLLVGDRAAAGAAAAVRRREGLVQVELHDVDAEVARSRPPHQRVEVGAVAVHQRRPCRGASARCFGSSLSNRPDRVRVGDHDRRDVVVDEAGRAARASRCRLRRPGRAPPCSPLSAHDAGLVPCAVSGMSTFFGLRPCAWCHARIIIRPVSSPCAPAAGCRRDPVHPADLGEPALEPVHQLERALDHPLRRVRVQIARSPAGAPPTR